MRGFIITGVVLVVIFLSINYAEYSAIKKHYPSVTFGEFLLIGDKLAVTPEK